MREQDVFLAAMDHDRPEDRAAYLDRACAGDTALRHRVEKLIQFDAAGDFLSTPAARRVAGIDTHDGDLPPGRVGHFELLEPVGRGGMGIVYRAWDTRLSRDVAIKLLQGGLAADPSVAQRFRHEAQVTARLQHPGVPPVHEVGELPDGRPFLAMKLVAGRTLADLLRDRPDPSHDRGRLVAAFESVCQAVAYAHSRGVIHRDLKPANVMVGAFGEVQVMDWGLAKDLSAASDELAADGNARSHRPAVCGETVAVQASDGRTPPAGDSNATRAGMILGTPGYMAPEQARGESADQRSDVFGLGAVLCAILTGTPPFDGPTTADTLRANAAGDPAAARDLLARCGADAELVALCEQCLSARPAGRPADAGVVAAEVAAWRSRAEDRARRAEVDRAEAAVREGELRKRRRVWLGLAAVSVVGFAVAIGLALWANAARGREAEARTKAEQETQLATAVKDFLQKDVLLLADPDARQQDGKLAFDADVRLRDVVLRAAKEIDGKFADRPLIEAELRSTLGRVLHGMGRSELAVPQHERARQVYADELGPHHATTLREMFGLSAACFAAGRKQESLALRETTLALMRQHLGPDDPVTIFVIGMLAVSYLDAGRQTEALPLANEALTRGRAALGPDHRHTLSNLDILAYTYGMLKQWDKALPLYEEATRLLKAKLGPDHPSVLHTQGNLGEVYGILGRHQDALAQQEDVLPRRRKVLGPDHDATWYAESQLAGSYAAVGRHPESLALREQTLARRSSMQGADHPEALVALQNVIESLVALRRTDDGWQRIDGALEGANRAEAAGKTLPETLKPDLLDLRRQVCRDRKDTAGLRRTAELLEALPKPTADALYFTAACHAALAKLTTDDPAEAKAAADRAVAWLTKAAAAGFNNRARVETDPDFDTLLGREDYAKVVASLRPSP